MKRVVVMMAMVVALISGCWQADENGMEDETDTEEDRLIRRQGEGVYTVQALTPIEDFNHYYGTRFSDDEFDTIGGLVISGFGHMPRRGETTEIGDFQFEVIKADGRRLHELRVKRREG